MVKRDIEVLRAHFLKAYASVPFKLRDELVAIVDEEPFSWAAANIEIKGKTKKGDLILSLMDEIELLR